MNLRLQPVQVATGSDDQESRLVFASGFLIAVLVCLSAQHEADAGKWYLEAGFGLIQDVTAPLFADLDEAQAWIRDQLTVQS
ncbi:hypothetical protein [Methylobacterium flocculans]|uniref:hypothetical protein n=1 Tax=Methylobacterium flocculans TaxID=2984843 RepID=UPI0021F2BB57|nr:hypothetical protein [Methylobacterium sp. FF17]